jgi:hypothetical protein
MIDHWWDLLDTPLVAPEGFFDASQGQMPAQGVAAMRSQMDCTKSIRSSTDNSSNPGGGEGIGLDI